MKVGKTIYEELFLIVGVALLVGPLAADAHSQTPDYIVLSRTQALVTINCINGCSATITDAHISGKAEPVFVQLSDAGNGVWGKSPKWTLVSFDEKKFSFNSKTTYTLTITSLGADGKRAVDPKDKTPLPDSVVLIDTSPSASFIQVAGSHSVNLTSHVAFARLGSSKPLENVGPGDHCAHGASPSFVDLLLLYPSIEVDLSKTGLCEIDMDRLPYLDNPDAVRVVQGLELKQLKQSAKSDGLSQKQALPIGALVSALGDPIPAPGPPNLTKAKAPATEADAWLWINGTVTAGTGTAPAWVLDGKLAPLFLTQLMKGPTILTWFSACANVGNNKINGQAAKDVIDFFGPSLKNFHDWNNAVGSKQSIAPTYETNLTFAHRNLLAVGDVVWNIGLLNENQFVRTAIAHKSDLTKMPKQGDFKCGYDKYGWNLHFHTGFETGGALATAKVTNPKTQALIGTLPTYSIARFVPQIDGLVQLWGLSIESLTTGRYLFTTEHTAVNNKAGIPYLETVTGWKAVHVLSVNWTPSSNQNLSLNIAYTDGFSAPTYQRANGVKIGLAIKY